MKAINNIKKLKSIGTLCLIICSMSSCISTKSIERWELVKKDKNNEVAWVIQKREITGRKDLEYKIEGEIKPSPLSCLVSFRKNLTDLSEGIKKEDDYEYSTYKIVNKTKNSVTVYAIHDEPFPLKDTEMSIKYTFFERTDGSAGVEWKEAWDENPAAPSKKLKRIETFRGSWQFSSSCNGLYKAVNKVQTNLEGVPIWLAEPMIIKFLKIGFENMKSVSPK